MKGLRAGRSPLLSLSFHMNVTCFCSNNNPASLPSLETAQGVCLNLSHCSSTYTCQYDLRLLSLENTEIFVLSSPFL